MQSPLPQPETCLLRGGASCSFVLPRPLLDGAFCCLEPHTCSPCYWTPRLFGRNRVPSLFLHNCVRNSKIELWSECLSQLHFFISPPSPSSLPGFQNAFPGQNPCCDLLAGHNIKAVQLDGVLAQTQRSSLAEHVRHWQLYFRRILMRDLVLLSPDQMWLVCVLTLVNQISY